MSKKVFAFLVVGLVVIGFVQILGGRGDVAKADDPKPDAKAEDPQPDAEEDEAATEDAKQDYAVAASKTAEYVGAAKCKACHFKPHKSWTKMLHAGAWEALPEMYRNETSTDKAGRACASCHTTGFGATEQKGFVDAETSKHLLGVQCEACHGAASEHIAAVATLKARSLKKFPAGEDKFIAGAGRDCRDCHNPHFSFKETVAKEMEGRAKAEGK